MTDHTELEQAARAALDVLNQDRSKMTPADEVAIDFGLNDTIEAFDDLSGPSAVLSLIAEVRELRAQLEEAREALAPFAIEASSCGDFEDTDRLMVAHPSDLEADASDQLAETLFTIGDLRAAASILEKGQSND